MMNHQAGPEEPVAWLKVRDQQESEWDRNLQVQEHEKSSCSVAVSPPGGAGVLLKTSRP